MTRPTREQRLATDQAIRDADHRRLQARVLDAADRLDPADQSLSAQQIRATAADIISAPDVADQREAVWGAQ
ncbi:hypothetical protein [Frankia sp. ACN1ag]|uniref:hypothetical protein n=1 Tax=Frankia sp. ACN1ag TaxID=102891 RepID=UPI0006DC5E3C|nr:hypothetical protein [Frankia sp. ACN1ag]KQC35024.1 hypothetical protein UK82_28565 [Frankia sp. ACN1ag]